MRPIPALDEKRVARLIADLDDDAFDVREAASQELAKAAESPQSACQKALNKAPSLEAKRRLEAIIEELNQQRRRPSAQRLQVFAPP